MIPRPETPKPQDPRFSAGPCKKRPGWRADRLRTDVLGRYHRSAAGQQRIREALDKTRDVLGVPETHRLAITPASDTGAVELAMWNLLGARGVDVLAWDAFGKDWARNAVDELKLADCRVLEADYGALPDLGAVRSDADIVFAWNGTTSGVCVPDARWIAADRTGLTICDATSAAFARELAWDRLDVVTFSFQKALGGEAQHGVIAMNDRAIARLDEHTPPWPVPKVFRVRKNGVADRAFFDASTINTPSLLVIEDWIDALDWARSIGGGPALIARADANLAAVEAWVATTPWVDFLARDPQTRSNTSVCLSIVDPEIAALPDAERRRFVAEVVAVLDAEDAGRDLAGYRAAPPGFRVWCGATVEPSDVTALGPWLDWAYATVKARTLASVNPPR